MSDMNVDSTDVNVDSWLFCDLISFQVELALTF